MRSRRMAPAISGKGRSASSSGRRGGKHPRERVRTGHEVSNLAARFLAGALAYPLDATDPSGAGPAQAPRRLARQSKTADLDAAMGFIDGLGVFDVGGRVVPRRRAIPRRVRRRGGMHR